MAEHLRAAGIAYRQMVTCGPRDATMMARLALAEGAERLIVVGGDGTLNEVVSGCLDTSGSATRRPVTLALLPSGTGSDLARGLGIPGGAAAVALLQRGQARPLDVGLATFRDAQGGEVTRAFANVADFGLGPQTSRAIVEGPKGIGPAAYLYGALRAIAAYDPTPIRVMVDGETIHAGPSGLVAVANGSHFGGGMQIAPTARPDDGALDVLVLGQTTRRVLVGDLLPKLYRGAHLGHPAVRHARGSVVAVEAAIPFPLELDGEVVGSAPARFAVVSGALRVLVPGE